VSELTNYNNCIFGGKNFKMNSNIPTSTKPRVVIIGGGFGGLQLANSISTKKFQVVLIDRNNFHQFQPLFYQVATAGLEPSSISFPFRKIFQGKENVVIRMGVVKEINSKENKILTSIGEIAYDHLIISTGADTNYFGNKEIAANALPMKSISEALNVRNMLFQ
jgi:NADH dehydrogenase